MLSDIQAIFDVIVDIQKNHITPPSGEKDIAEAFDETPAQVMLFPAFVNVLELGEVQQFPGTHRHIVHHISMHLVFAPAEQKYAERSLRAWLQPVLDAFGTRIQLAGTAQRSAIVGFSLQPIDMGNTSYIALTFNFTVDTDQAFAAAA